MLHIGLADDPFQYYAVITQMADRIQCLSLPYLHPQFNTITFPFLKRLRTSSNRVESLVRLSRSRFPMLRHLDLGLCLNRGTPIVDESVDVPFLQTLRLVIDEGAHFMRIAHQCTWSLKSLDVVIPGHSFFSQEHTITLPQLENLRFMDHRHERSLITMITPMLTVFATSTRYDSASFPLTMYLGVLTHVCAEGQRIPPLLELSGLRVLQLKFYTDVDLPRYSDVLKRLLDDKVCPELEIVELGCARRSDAEISDIKTLFLEINRHRGNHIELHIATSEAYRHVLLPHLVRYPVSDPFNLPLFVSLTYG